jgi:DNA replication protein DnaC
MSGDLTKLHRELLALRDKARRERWQRKRDEQPLTAEEFEARLKQFREYAAGLPFDPDGPQCEACGSTGWRMVVDGSGRRRAEKCDCREHHRASLGVSHLPEEFAGASLANYAVSPENARAVEAAREMLDGRRKHLFLSGDVGRGKSRLGASVANEFAERGIGGAFIRVPWFILLQQLSIDDAAKKPEETMLRNDALNTSVVILDDLAGAEKGSDFTRGVITTLLDVRFDRGLRTIVTSNLGYKRLAAFYGDSRISSRLARACGLPLEVGGVDQRVANFKAKSPIRLVDR